MYTTASLLLITPPPATPQDATAEDHARHAAGYARFPARAASQRRASAQRRRGCQACTRRGRVVRRHTSIALLRHYLPIFTRPAGQMRTIRRRLSSSSRPNCCNNNCHRMNSRTRNHLSRSGRQRFARLRAAFTSLRRSSMTSGTLCRTKGRCWVRCCTTSRSYAY